MVAKYEIRLKTAQFSSLFLNGKVVELVTAEGLGENQGKQMVKVGEVYEREEDVGLIHMAVGLPEHLIEYSVVDVAPDEGRLRRGEIMSQSDKKGLWVPVEKIKTQK